MTLSRLLFPCLLALVGVALTARADILDTTRLGDGSPVTIGADPVLNDFSFRLDRSDLTSHVFLDSGNDLRMLTSAPWQTAGGHTAFVTDLSSELTGHEIPAAPEPRWVILAGMAMLGLVGIRKRANCR